MIKRFSKIMKISLGKNKQIVNEGVTDMGSPTVFPQQHWLPVYKDLKKVSFIHSRKHSSINVTCRQSQTPAN
jgi:hypothetical protein